MKASPLVVAVDCSTTAAKALVVDDSGRVLATGRSPLATTQPAPGFHEQDATQWLTATLAAIRTAVAELLPADRERIAAIACTHQRESFALLDAAGVPIRPAILWVDSRAHQQIAEIGGRPLSDGSSIHDVSGKPPDTTPAIYKIAWLADNEPQALAAAAHLADVQGYLALHLTGRFATSRASADTLGLFDLAQGKWADELVAAVGLRRDQLPELVDAGQVIGRLLPQVAAELGVPQAVVLVAGIGDGQSAGLTLGVAEPGVAYLNLGTSMVCGTASQRYLTSPALRTLVGVRPGTFVLETVLNAAAYLADWAANFANSTPQEMERKAAAIPAGAEGLLVLPYWNAAQTPYWDPLARGAVVGWHGRHTPAHLYRAILEGVALELRLQLGLLEQATGVPVRVLRAVGGGSRSRLWAQIVADVTGREVSVLEDGEYSALGAAINAFDALGARTDRPFALHLDRTVVPNPDSAATYDRIFAVYLGLYPALRDTFAALSEV